MAPGNGKFLTNLKIIEFDGAFSDFYSYVFAELALEITEFLDARGCCRDELIIYFDTTHGLNFAPALVYDSIKVIAHLLSYVYNEVKIFVVNAEPYVPNIESLKIHLVEELTVAPYVPPYGLRELKLLKTFVGESRQGEANRQADYRVEISKKINLCLSSFIEDNFNMKVTELKNYLNCLRGAIIGGYPLVLFTFYVDAVKLKNLIKKCLELFNSHIIVETDNNIRIERVVMFTDEFDRLVESYLISYVLERVGIKRREEVGYSDINNIREKLFKYVPDLNAKISYDLYTINTKLKEKTVDEWTRLSNLIETSGWSDRNFRAHSGLEANVTVIKKKGEELLFKYDKNKYKNVIDASKGTLLKIS